jgi:DNA-binding transcriptional regulator YiaG
MKVVRGEPADATERVELLMWLRQSMKDGRARKIRESAGLSYSEAAGPAGIEVSTLYRWEKGLHRPRGAAAVEYARLLRYLQQRAAA